MLSFSLKLDESKIDIESLNTYFTRNDEIMSQERYIIKNARSSGNLVNAINYCNSLPDKTEQKSRHTDGLLDKAIARFEKSIKEYVTDKTLSYNSQLSFMDKFLDSTPLPKFLVMRVLQRKYEDVDGSNKEIFKDRNFTFDFYARTLLGYRDVHHTCVISFTPTRPKVEDNILFVTPKLICGMNGFLSLRIGIPNDLREVYEKQCVDFEDYKHLIEINKMWGDVKVDTNIRGLLGGLMSLVERETEKGRSPFSECNFIKIPRGPICPL